MKPSILLIGVILIALNCIGADKKESADKKKHPKNSSTADHMFDIKAAKIIFNFTGGLEPGKETLYFDDYGNVAVLLIDRKSKFSSTNKTMIWKNNQTTTIDHEKKIVTKTPFRNKDTEAPAVVQISEATRKSIGYEKLPGEIIAGKSCEVWNNNKLNVKYWIWKKIDLKKVNQTFTKEAVSVEEINAIPSSIMEIPKDYKGS